MKNARRRLTSAPDSPRKGEIDRFGKAFGIVLFAAALAGCTPEQVSSPRAVAVDQTARQGPTLPPVQPGDSQAVDSLARAMAAALANPDIRVQIHDDLRDSPFSRHGLHLPSYLSGARGRILLVALAKQAGVTEARIKAMAATRGGLQLTLPRATDRMSWEAGEEVAVEGTTRTLRERLVAERTSANQSNPTSAVAFRGPGVAFSISVSTEMSNPFLSISPSVTPFGISPEQRRSRASRASRKTVSTAEEEIQIFKERGDSLVRAHPDSGRSSPTASFLIVCPPDPEDPCNGGPPPPPPPPPPGRPMGVSIPSGKNYAACYRPGQLSIAVDADRDGVDDQCESELAVAFQPQLVFDFWDCEIRRQPQYAVRQKVSPDWGGVILIFYAISYMYDCGPDSHYGDSEWIIVEVGPSTNSSYGPWSLKYATLSAHWGAPTDHTAGYAAQDLEDAIGSNGFGAPRVWVSVGKHANYRTQIVCETAGWFNLDSCNHPIPYIATIPVSGAAQNLGSSTWPFKGQLGSPVPDGIVGSSRVEYYWYNYHFCGWLQIPPPNPFFEYCAGRYQQSLVAYLF